MAETFLKLWKLMRPGALRKDDAPSAGQATSDDVHVATALGNDRRRKAKTYKQIRGK